MKKFVSLLLVLIFMLSVVCICASAKVSPSPEDYYVIEVHTKGATGDDGAIAKPYYVSKQNKDSTFTLIAYGDDFTYWIIKGKYEIVSGDIYSKTLVVRPMSDIDATAVFNQAQPSPTNPNNGQKSPQTSSNIPAVAIIIIIALIATAGTVIAVKKVRSK